MPPIPLIEPPARARVRRWLHRHLQRASNALIDRAPLAPSSLTVLDAAVTVIEWVERAACVLTGHTPVPDHCGIPAHDYCIYCEANLPGAASRQG